MEKRSSNVLNVLIIFVVAIAAGVLYKRYQNKKITDAMVTPPIQNSYNIQSDTTIQNEKNQEFNHNLDIGGQNVNLSVDTTK
ncbi:hypothetical protein [Rhizosphaericola mali]|uniref:Uncharacterized protein n=1 Tax=Rhizosphaericola mali TaxID=2545455 RepID=A0A5P2G6E5_9BACT|nr:hypothetical protein [Rhizosphaericola mali]QES89360.1 hypothetical protein E0W69_012035 [Rhizosphaericola mali]